MTAQLPEPMIMSVVMNKGGVGKTTTTANLLAGILEQGKSKGRTPTVAAIDLDPQCNLSMLLGRESLYDEASHDGEEVLTVSEFLLPESEEIPVGSFFNEIPRPFFSDCGYILCSHPELEAIKDDIEFELKVSSPARTKGQPFDLSLYQEKKRKYFAHQRRRLKKGLAGIVDYIFIDTPPSLGFLTQFAISISDLVLPSICPGARELDGLYAIEDLVGSCWKVFNPDLQVVGILLNEIFARENLTKDVRDVLHHRYVEGCGAPELMFRSEVPRSVRIGECTSNCLTIFESEHPKADAAKNAYRAVLKEIGTRLLMPQLSKTVSASLFFDIHHTESISQEVVNG